MPRVRRCRQPGCHAMVAYPNHYCKQHFEHEAEYLANRQKYARAHDSSYTHKYNTVTRNRSSAKTDQYNFYRSKQWRSLRREALERDHYICQYCGKPNSKTVDHRVPFEVDPAKQADLANLDTICYACHKQKTDWEQAWYGTGKDNQIKSYVTKLTDVQTIKHMMARL